jgi:spore maturation protein CgeB
MKLVIFGLTITSSWGNGHATLWRGLVKALSRRGHQISFFERDVPYYAETRDLTAWPFSEILLYREWPEIRPAAEAHLREADAVIVTSYFHDARQVTKLALQSKSLLRVFYDLDTPVTLSRRDAGEEVDYLGPQGLRDFDLVLSFTGGLAPQELKLKLGARNVQTLFNHVDPETHGPTESRAAYLADLSYLGTYAFDRQQSLSKLLIEPARRLTKRRFLIAGALYPADFPWSENIYFVSHLSPKEHSAFFCSSRLSLNVTRQPMVEMGFSPSGRLFEAAACGTPVISDFWRGLDRFFQPGREILIAESSRAVLAALERPDEELKAIGRAARARILKEHTSEHRAIQLEQLLATA